MISALLANWGAITVLAFGAWAVTTTAGVYLANRRHKR